MIAERTDFVSVPVTDLERSTFFYRETLELEPGVCHMPRFDRPALRAPSEDGSGR